mmetsp:Transcript_29898/g.83558  ORF Transcript_29898/g.83558 Transcript_29898/m.83558 type:complete len:206 (-) Transcript_29898:125-742(-)
MRMQRAPFPATRMSSSTYSSASEVSSERLTTRIPLRSLCFFRAICTASRALIVGALLPASTAFRRSELDSFQFLCLEHVDSGGLPSRSTTSFARFTPSDVPRTVSLSSGRGAAPSPCEAPTSSSSSSSSSLPACTCLAPSSLVGFLAAEYSEIATSLLSSSTLRTLTRHSSPTAAHCSLRFVGFLGFTVYATCTRFLRHAVVIRT